MVKIRLIKFFLLSLFAFSTFAQNDQAMMTLFFDNLLVVQSAVLINENLPLRIVTSGNGTDANVFQVVNPMTLDGQPVVIEVFHPQILERFTNVNGIALNEVRMRRIGFESFRTCQTVTSLWLVRNFIQEIPENVFRNCGNIRIIDLSGNEIEKLHPASFAGLNGLETFHLGMNRISSLNADQFTNLPRLQFLSLDSNPIGQIPLGVFPTNIERLDLVGCSITEFYPDTFRNLTRLTSLRLPDNPITELPRGVFNDLVSLEGLSLIRTRIRRLNTNSFGFLPRMVNIWIESSTLDEIQPGFFDNFPNLDSFQARGNACVNTDLRNVSSIDFMEDERLHQCFANWFVPRP